MNEELLNQALTSVLETITQTKDFVIAEAPEVVQQLIAYKLVMAWSYIFLCVLAIICILIGTYYGIKSIRKQLDKPDEVFPMTILVLMGSVVFLIAPFLIMMENFALAMKIHIAPKVYIIEYVKDLIT